LKLLSLPSFVALTAGLVVGTVLSSFSFAASAADFGSLGPAPIPSERPPVKGVEARFGSLGPESDLSKSIEVDLDLDLDLDGEIAPEDLAAELGLPADDDSPFENKHGLSKNIPQTRVVAPENFGDFRVNLDIFRKSKKRRVLGEFREEYVATLVPNADGMSDEARTVEAKKRFENLAGREFAVASLDGKPFKAYIVSGGIEQKVAVVRKDAEGHVLYNANGTPQTRSSMKSTPPGNYRLDALAYEKKLKSADGSFKKVPVAFPWIRSRTYNNSQMYWGLWIKGGYFIHSTPHYNELGRPASMGCIRQSFPDAQELFKLIVEENLPGMIRIHPIGAQAPVSRLREIVVDLPYIAPENAPINQSPLDPSKDMSWLLGQLQTSYQNIRDSVKYYGKDVNIVGHAWIDEITRRPSAPTWPSCGDLSGSPIDCFKTWRAKKPKNSLN